MKGHVGAFLLGLGLAGAGAFIYDKYRRGDINVEGIGQRIKDRSRDVARQATRLKDQVSDVATIGAAALVDINRGSAEDFERIGIHDRQMVDRLVEGRPYRNKMDLLTRMILPQEVYDTIKHHIEVGGRDEAVKVA